MITVRVPNSLHGELLGEARKEGMSLNQCASQSLRGRSTGTVRKMPRCKSPRKTNPDTLPLASEKYVPECARRLW